MAPQPDYPLLSAEEFLQIDFGERKAELDNGVIRMMAGGTARHARVQANIIARLMERLRHGLHALQFRHGDADAPVLDPLPGRDGVLRP